MNDDSSQDPPARGGLFARFRRPPDQPAAEAAPAAATPAGWFQRLRHGLSRSSSKLTDGIAAIFTKRRLDDDAIEALEELLIGADLGLKTAAELTGNLRRTRFGKDVTDQ
jgi:fused signal recognition particle receptor